MPTQAPPHWAVKEAQGPSAMPLPRSLIAPRGKVRATAREPIFTRWPRPMKAWQGGARMGGMPLLPT